MSDTIFVVPAAGPCRDGAARRAAMLAVALGTERGRSVPVIDAHAAQESQEAQEKQGTQGTQGTQGSAMMVLNWEARRWWPVLHNLRRGRRLLGAGGAVLLVRAQPPLRPYRHALFPTDFSEASLASLRLAMRVLPHMRFTLLHSYRVHGEGPMAIAGVGDEAFEACRRRAEGAARAAGYRFVQRAHTDGARLALLVVRHRPVSAVVSCASLAAIDLLVLADAAGPRWQAWCRQARMHDMLAGTGCDALLVRAGH